MSGNHRWGASCGTFGGSRAASLAPRTRPHACYFWSFSSPLGTFVEGTHPNGAGADRADSPGRRERRRRLAEQGRAALVGEARPRRPDRAARLHRPHPRRARARRHVEARAGGRTRAPGRHVLEAGRLGALAAAGADAGGDAVAAEADVPADHVGQGLQGQLCARLRPLKSRRAAPKGAEPPRSEPPPLPAHQRSRRPRALALTPSLTPTRSSPR